MSDPITVIDDFPRPVREIAHCWIPMPDGVRLAARIWLPQDAEDNPVPAILEYLPYRKRDGTVERDALTHPYFAGHGYAGVRVDLRGSGDSEGVCLGEYLQQEQDDALAVIDWLAAQPWCSGRVGMIGISWGGFNGLQVAARRPPALGAVVSLCSTDDRFADDIHSMGGALLCDKLNWGATAFAIANTPPDPALVGERWRDLWRERLEHNGLWMLDWFRHQRRDAFYAHGSVCERYADIEIPVYMVGGWADGYTNAILRTLEHLPGPAKGLIGPWGHQYPHFAKPGPRIGFLQECLRWWDQHLKGIDTGIMDEPSLRAWLQGPAPPAPGHDQRPGRWVAEPLWRGAVVASQCWHVTAAGLGEVASREPLEIASPQTAGAASGLWCGYGVVPDGPLDQRGEGGLLQAFETPPLDDALELLGFPELHAQVASATPQANLVAVLSAVDADGRATLISYGVLNLIHRDSHAEPAPMPTGTGGATFGEPVPIRLRLNACGQRIARGQRLRLALGTAYWPVIWPSPSAARLQLTDARLELPQRPTRDIDRDLADFAPPESAAPMAKTLESDGHYERERTIDQITGVETLRRRSDSGLETNPHTGLSVRHASTETWIIHPDDPNTACGSSDWVFSFARDDWRAELRTCVTVRATREHWVIDAELQADDQHGSVARRRWHEEIPRDHV